MNKHEASTPKMLLTAVAAGLGGMLFASQGCIFTNQNHCALNQGSCDGGMVCSMCASENNGCVSAVESEQCRFGETTTTETTQTTTETVTTGPTTDSETTDTTTTEPTTTDTTDTTDTIDTTTIGFTCSTETPDDGQCPEPDAPYCIDGESCGDCTQLQGSCADVNEATPVCNADTGLCVECLPEEFGACSDEAESVCNAYTNTCSGCFEHEQCASGACDLENGTCFDDNVVWVQKRVDCTGEDGSEENPYCDLANAIDEEAIVETEIIFKVKHTPMQQHTSQILIVGAYRLAIIGQETDKDNYPEIGSNAAQPRLDVKSGANVFVSRMKFTDSLSASTAIDCDSIGTDLWLDQTVLRNNQRPLTINDGCTVDLRRSDVSNNENGIVNSSGSLDISNTFITHNHNEGYTNKDPALALHGLGNTTVVYSMILDSPGIGASAVNCPGASDVLIRNSVVLGPIDDLHPLFGGCNTVESKNWSGDEPDSLSDNFVRESMDYGVYVAQEDGPDIVDLAEWKVGDPFTDFSGDVRPFVDGSPDYAGADRP